MVCDPSKNSLLSFLCFFLRAIPQFRRPTFQSTLLCHQKKEKKRELPNLIHQGWSRYSTTRWSKRIRVFRFDTGQYLEKTIERGRCGGFKSQLERNKGKRLANFLEDIPTTGQKESKKGLEDFLVDRKDGSSHGRRTKTLYPAPIQ